jgi:hypothetical protein
LEVRRLGKDRRLPTLRLKIYRTEKSAQKCKEGAGASPLFIIDAPKPETESRFGSGHPGKPIFFKVVYTRASGMPGANRNKFGSHCVECMRVRKNHQHGYIASVKQNLQNLTEMLKRSM